MSGADLRQSENAGRRDRTVIGEGRVADNGDAEDVADDQPVVGNDAGLPWPP
jgi:hypothetical protein